MTHADPHQPDDQPISSDAPEGTPRDASPEEAAAPLTPQEQLDVSQERVAELEDRVRRLEAEFVNETRRIRRQADDQRRYAAEKVVVDLLPVLDALHSAGTRLSDSDDAGQVREGLALVGKQMSDVLGRHGIERIEALDMPFDPAKHEAMLMVEDPDRAAQTVCQEMSPGYVLHGRVIRAAQVIVVKGSPASAAGTGAPGQGADTTSEEADDADV